MKVRSGSTLAEVISPFRETPSPSVPPSTPDGSRALGGIGDDGEVVDLTLDRQALEVGLQRAPTQGERVVVAGRAQAGGSGGSCALGVAGFSGGTVAASGVAADGLACGDGLFERTFGGGAEQSVDGEVLGSLEGLDGSFGLWAERAVDGPA